MIWGGWFWFEIVLFRWSLLLHVVVGGGAGGGFGLYCVGDFEEREGGERRGNIGNI